MLANVIIENISKFHISSDALDFLEIFNLDHKTNASIVKFVMTNFKDFSSDIINHKDESSSEDSDTSNNDEAVTDSSEYFDSD